MRGHRHTKAVKQQGRGVVEVKTDPNYSVWTDPRLHPARVFLGACLALFLLFVLLGLWRRFSIWREERFLDREQVRRDELDGVVEGRRIGPVAFRLKQPAREAVFEEYNPLDEGS